MRSGRSSLGGAFAIGAILAALGCATPSLRDERWTVLERERYQLHSTMSAAETTTLAVELERFDALVRLLTSASSAKSAVPMQIFVFANGRQYAHFGPKHTAGVFIPGVRSNLMLIANGSRQLGASEVLLHEYVHHVLRDGSSRVYPRWYDEGMAELLSTTRIDGEQLEIGGAPASRVPALHFGRWLPLERVVAVRDYAELDEYETDMFYAQAWLLTHYLSFDRPDAIARIGRETLDYFARLASGADPVAAFEAAFGESTETVGAKLREIVSRGHIQIYGYPESRLAFDRAPAAGRAPQPGEMATRLGEIHLERGAFELAEREFRTAIAVDPSQARAHAGLGDAIRLRDRWDEAEPHFLRAVELDGDDPLNLLDLGEFYESRGRMKAATLERLRADLTRARQLYRQVLERDADCTEAWLVLARTHLAAGERPGFALRFLERARRLRPSSMPVLAVLAETQLARGDELLARDALRQMFAFRAEGQAGPGIEAVLTEIRERRAAEAARVGLTPSLN
ncbi:MAG: tetratricopeptide repeat protein [Myxococcota bacterium]